MHMIYWFIVKESIFSFLFLIFKIMKDGEIGVQIKKARIESQLTQKELGEKIGVTWEMISRYENGKSSPRKNLEKIAETLDKPIQYFFGVEEVPLSDEIKRLTTLLSRKSDELQKSDVGLLETLEGFTLKKALDLTNQSYNCPRWISVKFENAFALKLDDISSTVLGIGSGDIGFFTNEVKAKKGDHVLIKHKKAYKIERYSSSLNRKPLAVLLAVEKRYYKE